MADCSNLIANMCGDRGLVFPDECDGKMPIDFCGENELYAPECSEETGGDNRVCYAEVCDAVVGCASAKMTVSIRRVQNGTSIGDTIDLTYTVRNTGSVMLDEVTLTAEDVGVEETWIGVDIGDSRSYAFTYTITENDIINGSVTFSATAKGITEDEEATASTSVTVPVDAPDPSIRVDVGGHTTNPNYVDVRFTVINDGNLTLNDVELRIPLTEETFAIPSLAVGGYATFTSAHYECTPEDFPITFVGIASAIASNMMVVDGEASYTFTR